MIASEDHPLVRAWLRRFDASAVRLPEVRRAELRAEVAAHLHEATSPDMPDGAVRDVLDELGEPAAIVREESAEVPSTRRVPWIVGGALLILSVVVQGVTQYSGTGGVPLRELVWAAGLLVLALARPSVTARRPLGTGAIVGLAIWSVASTIVGGIIARSVAGVGGDTAGLVTWGYVDSAGLFVLALIAVVQISRVEAVRRPWRWVPAWVLGVVTAVWLLDLLVGALAGPAAVGYFGVGLGGLVMTGGTLVLGIVAIGLGAGVLRQQGGTPPAADDA
ncbi:hypothetical protein [Pseudolysinimonas sp.]|uniref:hypothetical protein n=1 Tax=Pseudolysinimonas sp. TaxID=2680009 RepID=UPI003F81C76A